MNKRTPVQWQALFAAQQASGLSQAQFCKEQKLCPKYFSLRRKQLAEQQTPHSATPFVQAIPPTPSSSSAPVVIAYHDLQLRFHSPNAELITTIIKSLV